MRLIMFLLLAALAVDVFPQCSYPAIGGGGSGVGATDTAILGSMPSLCTACATQSRVCWSLPDSFNGSLYFYSPNAADTFSVQVMRDCHYLMMDTCSLLPVDPAATIYVLRFYVLGTVQVCVSGQSGDTVVIVSKSTPSPQEELSVVLADLDSCGGQTSIPEPLAPQWEYYKWIDGSRVYPPLEHGIYFRRDETNPKDSRIIRAIE